ncbi:MAG TPA: DUF4160 domain-containing protein [Blastocatellia bacterium]|nr:DUF4160 domain-containing protein [Blastocatellia bacterium]
MPAISMFYGIIVSMYFFDNNRHHRPHVHVKYQDQEAVFGIPDGDLIDGELRSRQVKLAQAWIEIHRDELMADWTLASDGQPLFPIDPLK